MTRAALALLVALAALGARLPAAASAGTTTATASSASGHDHDARRGHRRARRRRRGFDPQAIYKEEAPGVVTVISLFGGDSLEDLGDASGGVGSGFVINGDGEIATNAHVVTTGEVPDLREARTVYVEFADGNQVAAEIGL